MGSDLGERNTKKNNLGYVGHARTWRRVTHETQERVPRPKIKTREKTD